jgi:hypothetical protein
MSHPVLFQEQLDIIVAAEEGVEKGDAATGERGRGAEGTVPHLFFYTLQSALDSPFKPDSYSLSAKSTEPADRSPVAKRTGQFQPS